MEVKRFLPLHAYLKAFQTLDPSYSVGSSCLGPGVGWCQGVGDGSCTRKGSGAEEPQHRAPPGTACLPLAAGQVNKWARRVLNLLQLGEKEKKIKILVLMDAQLVSLPLKNTRSQAKYPWSIIVIFQKHHEKRIECRSLSLEN